MEENNVNEWQEPPPPEDIKQIENPPQMSEVETLGKYFIEPGRTFEDMRRKPRFLIAGINNHYRYFGISSLYLFRKSGMRISVRAESSRVLKPNRCRKSKKIKLSNSKVPGFLKALLTAFFRLR